MTRNINYSTIIQKNTHANCINNISITQSSDHYTHENTHFRNLHETFQTHLNTNPFTILKPFLYAKTHFL